METSELFNYFKYSRGITGEEWQSREGYIVRKVQGYGKIYFKVESPVGHVYSRSFAYLPTALRFILKKQGDI